MIYIVSGVGVLVATAVVLAAMIIWGESDDPRDERLYGDQWRNKGPDKQG